jgi:hypothetical protein
MDSPRYRKLVQHPLTKTLTKTHGWKLMTLKRGRVCGVCGKWMRVGTKVMWIAAGSNPRHLDCHKRKQKETAPASRPVL